jgi:hypothetical protein
MYLQELLYEWHGEWRRGHGKQLFQFPVKGLAAEPPIDRDREALFAAAPDTAGEEVVKRLAQHSLADAAATMPKAGQREAEFDQFTIEKWSACF